MLDPGVQQTNPCIPQSPAQKRQTVDLKVNLKGFPTMITSNTKKIKVCNRKPKLLLTDLPYDNHIMGVVDGI